MKNRIFFKLVVVFALVIAAATLTLDVAITHAWRSSLRQQIESNLRQKTAMFALRVAAAPLSSADLKPVVQSIAEASGARATVIDGQGQVLGRQWRDSRKHGEPRPPSGISGGTGRADWN